MKNDKFCPTCVGQGVLRGFAYALLIEAVAAVPIYLAFLAW